MWHRDESFWREMGPAIIRPQRWEIAAQEVEQVGALSGVEPGATVLDMPCGPGRHSLELARRGFRVTAVDCTAEYLDEARRGAKEAAATIEFVEEDMRLFRRSDAFDLAINLYTSFGYFDDPADEQRVLKNFRASLRPGGTLVMELMGREVLARVFRQRDWSPLEDGSIMLEEREVTDDWTWVHSRWIRIDGAQRYEHRVATRLYAGSELKSMLHAAGFDEVRLHGGLDGRSYDHEAQRLVAVAR